MVHSEVVQEVVQKGFTRRTLLTGALAGAGVAFLAACSPGGQPSGSESGKPSGEIKFWDTVWGPPTYVALGTSMVNGFKQGDLTATYQSVAWANWYQTFASALASKTGPAVSTGASTQVYQFYDEGQIAPADNLYATMKKKGTIDDFIDTSFDVLKYDGKLVAMPWSYDLGAYWYRKSLLEKAGADVPTDWDTLRETGLKLKAIGVSGFGVNPTTNGQNWHQYGSILLTNNAPFVDDDGNVVCLDDRFIEGTEYLLSLAKDDIIQKKMATWDAAILTGAVSSGDVAITSFNSGLSGAVTADAAADLDVMSPIAGPTGDKWGGGSVQNIMMYTNTPSQQGSEDFLEWYLDNMKAYWEEGVTSNVPVRKSIIESIKDTSPFIYKIGQEYAPLTKPEFGSTFNSKTAKYDASPALTEWAQRITLQDGTAKDLCEKLQAELEKI